MKDYSKFIEMLEKQDDITYYILGAFVTDGSVRLKNPKTSLATECEISSKDKDWINLINNVCGGEAKVIEKGNMARVRYWNKSIFDLFIQYGCTPVKSLNLKFPLIPEQYLTDFLRGCIDGDGSISVTKYKKVKNGKEYWYNKTNAYLCGSSLDFLKEFSFILDNKGISYSLIESKNTPEKKIKYKHPHYRVHMNDSFAKQFLNWIYYPGNRIAMPRKQNLVHTINSLV